MNRGPAGATHWKYNLLPLPNRYQWSHNLLANLDKINITGIILCMRSSNERRRYNVTSSLIGWAHLENEPCIYASLYTCKSMSSGTIGQTIIQFSEAQGRILASVSGVIIG